MRSRVSVDTPRVTLPIYRVAAGDAQECIMGETAHAFTQIVPADVGRYILFRLADEEERAGPVGRGDRLQKELIETIHVRRHLSLRVRNTP